MLEILSGMIFLYNRGKRGTAFCGNENEGDEHSKMDAKINLWSGFVGYLKYIWKENKKLYLFGLFYFPASILADFLRMYLTKIVVQNLTDGKSVLYLGLSIIGVTTPLIICVLLRERMKAKLLGGNRMVQQTMHFDYAKKLLHVDYAYLENPEFVSLRDVVYKGFMGTQIGETAMVKSLDEFLLSIAMFLTVVGNIVLYAFYLCRLSPWMLLGMLFIPAYILLIEKIVLKQEIKYAIRGGQAWKKQDYVIRKTEDFSMAKDVRLYHMSDWFLGLYYKYNKKGLSYKKKELHFRTLGSVCNSILFNLSMGVMLFYVIFRYFDHSIRVGELVFYVQMMEFVINQCGWSLRDSIKTLGNQSETFARFEKFIRYGEDTGRDMREIQKKPPQIDLENVCFAYPGAKDMVLSNLSMKVNAGEKIAIVGVNGAGKTTLMKLICGLLRPASGRILINGKDMEDMTSEERYAWFSCAFQDIQFLPLSVRENISLQETTEDEKVWHCLELAGIRRDIEKLPKGLDTMMEKNINEEAVDFSGGQKQKLILARALYRNAGGLILDEPTAALDALAENEIYEKYRTLAANKTSFFVSHRLSSTRFCDRILLLDGGNIAEEGSHEMLLRQKGLYAKMFELQSKYYKQKEAVERSL